MENTSDRKKNQGSDQSKTVVGWAKAAECVAKALGAVVGLVTLIIWETERSK